MKTRSWISLGTTLGLLSLAIADANAGGSWSVSIFDGPLAACGHWDNRPGCGRCWHPAYVPSNWSPYCEGYWMWTDCGWYWVSSEPWAWATYHYGRWAYDSYDGWVWVPDTDWGSSWVCWRQGGGYCGWAPLPPGAVFGPGGDVIYRNGPVPDRFFVFVPLGRFAEPIHRRDLIVNNPAVLSQTVNITKITRVNNVAVNHGPPVDQIQKFNSRKLTEAPPRTAVDRGASTRYGRTLPEVVEPNAGGLGRAPANVSPTSKREPQVIRGGAGQSVYEYKQPGNYRAAPLPTVYKPATEKQTHAIQGPYQNFTARPSSPYSPVAPDSIQPRQHNFHEPAPENQPSHNPQPAPQESPPHFDQGRQDNPPKARPAGN